MGGPQISEEKICIFGKKLGAPENAEEKISDLRKKWWVGTKHHPEQIFSMCSANICLTPPPVSRGKFVDQKRPITLLPVIVVTPALKSICMWSLNMHSPLSVAFIHEVFT